MCSIQQSLDVSRLVLSGEIFGRLGGLSAGEYMQVSCMVHEEKVPIWKGESEGSKSRVYILASSTQSGALLLLLSHKGE